MPTLAELQYDPRAEMQHQPFTPPELPGREAIMEWGRGVKERTLHPLEALANVAQESIQDPTGTALNWANPMGAVGSGLAGIFAGKGAKTANIVMLDLAEKMKKAGIPDREIHAKTGWTFGFPDQKPRFEIPDNAASLQPAYKDETKKLYQALGHEDLYGAYPNMQGLTLARTPGGSGGALSDSGKLINVMGASDEVAGKSTTLHELQHAIQQREGFARGGSPDTSAGVGMTKGNTMDYARKAYEQSHQTSGDPLLEELLGGAKGWDELTKREQLGWIDQGRMMAYRNLAGEAEARLTQARMNMTSEQRLHSYPLDMFDVPVSEQLVRYGNEASQ